MCLVDVWRAIFRMMVEMMYPLHAWLVCGQLHINKWNNLTDTCLFSIKVRFPFSCPILKHLVFTKDIHFRATATETRKNNSNYQSNLVLTISERIKVHSWNGSQDLRVNLALGTQNLLLKIVQLIPELNAYHYERTELYFESIVRIDHQEANLLLRWFERLWLKLCLK